MGWGCGAGRTDVALESARRDFQPHAGLQLEGRGGVSLSVVVVGEEGGGGGVGLPVPSRLGAALEGLGGWEEDRGCGEDDAEGVHGDDGIRLGLDAELNGEEDVGSKGEVGRGGCQPIDAIYVNQCPGRSSPRFRGCDVLSARGRGVRPAVPLPGQAQHGLPWRSQHADRNLAVHCRTRNPSLSCLGVHVCDCIFTASRSDP